MEIVLDTVCLQKLILRPKRSRRRSIPASARKLATAIDTQLRQKEVILALDEKGGILDEWQSTCGPDTVQSIISYWGGELSCIKYVKPKKYSQSHRQRLRAMGFGCNNGTVDKLILRVAFSLSDKNIVSNDSDFWNPKKRSIKSGAVGNKNAPVAKYCREHLGITIMTLGTLVNRPTSR